MCRMGKEYANAYHSCPVDHFWKKNQRVQDKWAYATKCTEAIVDAAFPLLLRIFCTHREDKMKIILQNLWYINKWFEAFNDNYSKVFWPWSIMLRCNRTYKVTLVHYQHDCRALLADISAYACSVEPYVSTCKDIDVLNKFIHFAHTVAFYFQFIKQKNPAFFAKPPQHIWQTGLSYPEREYFDLCQFSGNPMD